MGEIYNKFKKDSDRKAFDLEHRSKIKFNMSQYNKAVATGKEQYQNLELARKRAYVIKHRVVNNLDKYLIEFAANFEKNGGKLIWAVDQNEAVKEILEIFARHEAKLVVKSKSMISEEIELNDALEAKNIETLETDLGEYIVQLAGEKPYHIVTPAMHKSSSDIAELFHKKLNTPADSTPEEMTGFVRKKLRQKFIDANIGITGANFIIADTGSICITENEGNAFMSSSLPKVHIAITGIEKIIPTINDLDLFWPMLATHGTGQKLTVYNSIISGPKRENESDGPNEMYLVLLDNNRSEVLKNQEQRSAMMCIRCGACLNACPVYKNIGGHSYGTTYSGPIGAVITPHLKNLEDYKHLSFASSLCGNCTESCPVKIPIHELLLENRYESVNAGFVSGSDKFTIGRMKYFLMKRKRMDMAKGKLKNIGMQLFFKRAWGSRRDMPRFAPKSFKEIWNEQRGNK